LKNYIGGKFVDSKDGQLMDSVNPATGVKILEVPCSGEADVDDAVAAAEEAKQAWRFTPLKERCEVLCRWADLIDANLERLAQAESLDNGKPVALARAVDIPRAATNLRYFANFVMGFKEDVHSAHPSVLDVAMRDPLGVVVCISPWNLPLYLLTWKVAPALAAGNCVIAKPSEITPYTAHLLCELCTEAGVPAGVFNVLHGPGAKMGKRLVEHPKVRAVSFTGSTATGRVIATLAAPLFKKVSLEMGGKNAALVFPDANLDLAVATTVRSAFANQGQICFCTSRLLVHQDIYAAFRDRLVARVRELVVGDPQVAGTNIGAVVSRDHMGKIMSYVDLARQEGGTILCGGETVTVPGRCKDGVFVAPTVVEGLPIDSRVNLEEIFGPVACLVPFSTEEEAVAMANITPYGLSAVVWTDSLARSQRVVRHLDAGIIWVNTWMERNLGTVFGGHKSSGVGAEGGVHALRFFTTVKNVTIKTDHDTRASYSYDFSSAKSKI